MENKRALFRRTLITNSDTHYIAVSSGIKYTNLKLIKDQEKERKDKLHQEQRQVDREELKNQ